MAQILCNPAFSPREYPVSPDTLINKAIEDNNLNEFVLVVPTGRLVRHFRNRIIRDYYKKHNKPAANINVFKLDTFVAHCFDKIADKHKYRKISDAYRLALFEEAAENARLHYFSRKNKPVTPVVLQRLANIIMGLKEDGVKVDDLKQDIVNAENDFLVSIDIPKLRDITAIYESYQKLLNGKYLDYPELIYKLIDHLVPFDLNESAFDELFPSEDKLRKKKFLDSIFPKGSIIFFYGFSEFKAPEVKLISLFARSSLPYAIHIDYSTKNGPLFGNLEETIINLTDNGFKLYSLEEMLDSNSEFLLRNHEALPRSQYLRRWLFNTELDIKNSKFSTLIKIFAAENRLDEVVAIAKLVRHLHLNKNIPLSEMCIALRHSDVYPNLFREIFQQYMIPVNITDRHPLAKSPVTVALFAVLDLVIKGFRRDDVHRALKSSYLTFERKISKSKKTVILDGMNLFDVASKLRIQGGLKRGDSKGWNLRLEKALEACRNRITNIESVKDLDPVEHEAANRQLALLQKAYDDFQGLIKILHFENKFYTPDEFLSIIKNEIIGKLRIKENILKFYNIIIENEKNYPANERVLLLERVEKDSRAYAALIKILDEMIFLIKDRKPDAKYKLEDYAHKLRTAVTAEKYSTREKQNYGVTITAIEQTRGIPYKVMILCGALDGEFPLIYRPENFLGKELPETEERFIRTERLQFYQFLSNGTDDLDNGGKELYITYPKSDGIEELVRSPFIDALLKITSLNDDNCVFDLDALRKRGYWTGQGSVGEYDLSWYHSLANSKEVIRLLGSLEYRNLNFGIKQPVYDDIVNLCGKYGISDTAGYVRNILQRKLSGMEPGMLHLTRIQEEIHKISKIKDKPFSITELETYASCPYKYFTKNIIDLEEEIELDLSLSATEQGSLLHRILYRFYSIMQAEQLKNGTAEIIAESRKKDMPPIVRVKLDPAKFTKYRNLLIKITEEEIKQIKFLHPFFEEEQLDFIGSNKKPGYIETWLRTEMDRMKEDWEFVPALFEFNFGMSTKGNPNELQSVELDDELKIRGKIDRIEFRLTDNGIEFIVADYKSSLGYLPDNEDVAKGIAFQVPLYLLAAEKIFKECYGLDAIAAGGVYYSLKPQYDKNKKKYNSNRFILLPADNCLSAKSEKKNSRYILSGMEELRNRLQDSVINAKKKISEISAGAFPVAPAELKNCESCSYQRVCRIKEVSRYMAESEVETEE